MVQSLLLYLYDYDSLGRLIRQEIKSSTDNAHIGRVEFGYDVRNNLTKVATEIGGYTAVDEYLYSANSGNANAATYAKDNLISRYKIAGTSTRYVDYTYDSLNRLNKKSLSLGTTIDSDYWYYTAKVHNEGTNEKKFKTTQLSREILDKTAYTYYYDKVGNITDIKLSTRSDLDTITEHKKYTYDSKNQLLSEAITKKDDNNNKVTTKVEFEYDDIGNITKKTLTGTENKTITYDYDNDGKSGWNNLLVGVNLDGNFTDKGKPVYDEATETIKYDSIGNPTNYLGAALTWNGRQLTSYTKDSTSVSYTYDADGLRATKDNNGEKSTYHYVSGQLRYETRGAKKFYYFYDASGNLSAIRYYPNGGTENYMYYPLTNSRGDIISIYNSSGTCVVTYEYDAWGNCTIVSDTSGINIGELNPIRYRGYYYDTETGLYYLQSRYYNPQVGRFLNADGYVTTGQGVLGYNMFAYCGNNPVNRLDLSGCSWSEFKSFCSNTWNKFKTWIKGDAKKQTTTQKTVDITDKLNNEKKLEEIKNNKGTIVAAGYFVNKVRPNGDWDFKSQDGWSLNPNTKYIYNGEELRFDDIGNIHYGYVGRVLFDTDTLLQAGGAVQILTMTSDKSYKNSNYDDPRDQWAISYGAKLWDEGGV